MLEKVDLSLKMDEEVYKTELKKEQMKLLALQRALVEHKLGCIIVFEGWDAAGKGSAIKRVVEKIDPRGLEVHATGAPNLEEKQHHYLQRFLDRMPKYEKIGIFDRSWYGRVLVERVEELAEEEEWTRAYDQINQMEKIFAQEDYFIIKFWFHISKEEQLKRFRERQNNPLKRWKITEEDWRNREKWDEYKIAVEDMLYKTDTKHAPWHVIEGEDKNFARVKTLKTIISTIEEGCKGREIDLGQYF
ncbi:polyphosphate kinase 2 family protein [Bacillus sp. FJAT-44742]|uniref:polyphosphate kinase 2 family protein n=1 Tax=Bacillus sp. FJAT-44742 TaxID=2014005 RepID=UPI000C2325AA|nr:UDP-galactose-lipid carrier transferase [Bacillus sp. FJAT-44742]